MDREPATTTSAGRLPDEARRELVLETFEHGDACVVLDAEFRILLVNEEQERLTATPRARSVGRAFWEVWPHLADPRGQLWTELHRAMRDRAPARFEALDPVRSTWLDLRVYPTAAGGLAVFSHDVTARRRAEEAVRESEERFRTLAGNAPEVIARFDGQLRHTYINEYGARLYGLAAPDVIGRTSAELGMPPDGVALWTRHCEEVFATGEQRTVEFDFDSPTFGAQSLSSLLVPERDEAGEVVSVLAITRDVTERRRSEAALREGEGRLRRMIDANPIGVLTRDQSGQVLYANDAYLRIVRASREDLESGRIRWDELTAPEHRARDEEASAEARARGVSSLFEKTYVLRDGSRVPVLIALASMGVPGQLTAFVLDLSERKRAEQALRETAERFTTLADHMAPLAWMADEKGWTFWFNRRWFDYTGATLQEMRGWGWRKAHHPDHVERVVEKIGRCFEAGERWEDTFPLRGRDGTYRWFLSRAVPIRGEGGRVVRWFGTATDITEQRRVQEALRESEQRLRAMFEDAAVGIVEVDAEDRFVAVNSRFCAMLGYAREELIGRSLHDITAPEDAEVTRDLNARGRAGELRVFDYEKRYVRRDGARLWVHVTVSVVRDEEGRFARAIGTAEDITERKRAQDALRASEERLRAANERLVEADRRKDEFLGMLSHELRNPLAPIRNALYILDHAAADGEQARRAKAVAKRQLAHMTRLVDDLLDVTRIARGKIELRRASLDLAALARRTAEDHRAVIRDRHLTLEVHVPEQAVVVHGDETRLAQVLGNLLHNAAKFTPAGGRVTLSVRRLGASAEIHVKDTGAGIAPEVLPTIFEPFTQAEQTLARSEGGLGLGLALVKGLVALHGGAVAAHSEGPGAGTDFVVTLPLAESPRAAGSGARGAVEATGAGRRRRVLVVDDNRDAADTLAQLVEMLGHQPEAAYDGYDGLARVAGAVPDVVLCDIGLPGMDGYEFARQLRAVTASRRVLLVAVSGYAQPEDVARAAEAGFDAHVAKPPDPEQLGRLLAAGP